MFVYSNPLLLLFPKKIHNSRFCREKYKKGVFNIKKTFIIVAVVLVFGSVLLSPIAEKNTKQKNASNSKNSQLTLTEYYGHTALFEGKKLIEEYPECDVSSLPLADQTALKKGIKVKSYDELFSLLEDFDY